MAATTIFSYSGDYITLGQFLKASNLAQSGGEAKEMLASGAVLVNAETEIRRGRKLRHGDIVRLGHDQWQIISRSQMA